MKIMAEVSHGVDCVKNGSVKIYFWVDRQCLMGIQITNKYIKMHSLFHSVANMKNDFFDAKTFQNG